MLFCTCQGKMSISGDSTCTEDSCSSFSWQITFLPINPCFFANKPMFDSALMFCRHWHGDLCISIQNQLPSPATPHLLPWEGNRSHCLILLLYPRLSLGWFTTVLMSQLPFLCAHSYRFCLICMWWSDAYPPDAGFLICCAIFRNK